MREIKFKAKRKYNNEWVYGHYAKSGDKYYILDIDCTFEQYSEYYERDILMTEYYEVIPETICQYTGLKDKNGVEIYENDVLKAHRVYKGENAGNDYKTVKWENRNCGCGFNISPRISNSFEVIGNIYDKEVK